MKNITSEKQQKKCLISKNVMMFPSILNEAKRIKIIWSGKHVCFYNLVWCFWKNIWSACEFCNLFVRHVLCSTFLLFFNVGCGVRRTPSATVRKMLWKYVWPLLTNAIVSSFDCFTMFLWYRDFGSAKRKHMFIVCLFYKCFRDPCVRIVEKMLTRSYNVKHRKMVLPRKKNLLNCVDCKNVILFFQY